MPTNAISFRKTIRRLRLIRRWQGLIFAVGGTTVLGCLACRPYMAPEGPWEARRDTIRHKCTELQNHD